MNLDENTMIQLIQQVISLPPGAISIRRLDRGQTNPTLSLFRVEGQENLVVKVFDSLHMDDGRRDIEQYNQLSNLTFVTKVRYYRVIAGSTLIAYEWIEGLDLCDFFRTKEGQVQPIREWAFRQVVDQTLAMGNNISIQYYNYLLTRGTKVSIANPLYKGLYALSEELRFINDYKIIDDELLRACDLFPGVYLDRNLGNTLIETRTDNFYQIDFGRMEGTSPLFDFAKLLRTQTGEPSVAELDSNLYIPMYELDIEKRVRDYAFTRFSSLSNFAWKGTNDEFERTFAYVALHMHIYFLTRAVGQMSHPGVHMNVMKARRAYHIHMLVQTYEQLLQIGEAIQILKPWVDKFVLL